MKRLNFLFVPFFIALGLLLTPDISIAEISQAEFQSAMEEYLKSDEGKKLLGSTVESYFRSRQAELRKQRQKQQEAQMEEQFADPVNIEVGSSPTKGPADAPVTIIEFSDFQCPYCSRANDTLEQLMKEYDGKIKLAFKNLPLPFHKEAKPAAAAALAAGKQGKFWEFHDALFQNQKSLNSAFYTKTAEKLGLDIEKFKADMKSEEIEKQIEADAKLAREHGISGTPGFFINGVAVRGAVPIDQFKVIIDRWLEKEAA